MRVRSWLPFPLLVMLAAFCGLTGGVAQLQGADWGKALMDRIRAQTSGGAAFDCS
jgi:hypothetical protein